MTEPGNQRPLADWAAAIAAALAHPEAASRGVRLFFETREDLTVEVSSATGPSSVHTRQCGLSANTGSGRLHHDERWIHLAEPSPEDAARLVHAALDPAVRFPAAPGREAGPLSPTGLEADAALAWIEGLLREIERLVPGALALGRWVQFDQQVLVGEPGREVAHDRRSGCRVHVQVWTVGPRPATAVSEGVLKPRPGGGRDTLIGPSPQVIAADVVDRLRRRVDARLAPAGRQTVVLGPGIGGVLVHEIVGHALEGDVAERGSWLTASDAMVAAEGLVVMDDPRRGRAPWRVDDEGQPATATPLIGAGQVRSRLHDRGTAERAGRPPTGHGRRSSYREPVRPRMGCTFIAAGRLNPHEVTEGVDGIYVRRMEAASVDARSGCATFRVTDADLLRGGRLEVPLHAHLLRVDARETLINIDRVADDLAFDRCVGSCHRDGQPLAVSVGAPTIRIGVVTVII